MDNKQHVFLKTASKILTYNQNLEFRFTSEYNLIKGDHISSISLHLSNKTMWADTGDVCNPILNVGLLLKHLQLKVLQLVLFTVVRQPESGVPHLRVLGCKLERRHKWTEVGGHLRYWRTFVYFTKAPYNWAQFVTTDSFCSKEAQIWRGTDVNSFSLSSVWTTGTKFTELIIPSSLQNLNYAPFPISFQRSLMFQSVSLVWKPLPEPTSRRPTGTQ